MKKKWMIEIDGLFYSRETLKEALRLAQRKFKCRGVRRVQSIKITRHVESKERKEA